MTYNSRRAQELGKWAETKGCGDAFHNAVFRAYFADGRNIADENILGDIAHTVGLNANEARVVIADRTFFGNAAKATSTKMKADYSSKYLAVI